MKSELVEHVLCVFIGVLIGLALMVPKTTNEVGTVVSTNIVTPAELEAMAGEVYTVAKPVQRDLPDGIVIQKSNDGKYRWVAFSKEWPNGYPDLWTHDSYDEAVTAYWKAAKWNEEKANQTWEPASK